jgi:hypothetical protein
VQVLQPSIESKLAPTWYSLPPYKQDPGPVQPAVVQATTPISEHTQLLQPSIAANCSPGSWSRPS